MPFSVTTKCLACPMPSAKTLAQKPGGRDRPLSSPGHSVFGAEAVVAGLAAAPGTPANIPMPAERQDKTLSIRGMLDLHRAVSTRDHYDIAICLRTCRTSRSFIRHCG